MRYSRLNRLPPRLSLADMLVLVGTAGGMAPPTSARISARLRTKTPPNRTSINLILSLRLNFNRPALLVLTCMGLSSPVAQGVLMPRAGHPRYGCPRGNSALGRGRGVFVC